MVYLQVCSPSRRCWQTGLQETHGWEKSPLCYGSAGCSAFARFLRPSQLLHKLSAHMRPFLCHITDYNNCTFHIIVNYDDTHVCITACEQTYKTVIFLHVRSTGVARNFRQWVRQPEALLPIHPKHYFLFIPIRLLHQVSHWKTVMPWSVFVQHAGKKIRIR